MDTAEMGALLAVAGGEDIVSLAFDGLTCTALASYSGRDGFGETAAVRGAVSSAASSSFPVYLFAVGALPDMLPGDVVQVDGVPALVRAVQHRSRHLLALLPADGTQVVVRVTVPGAGGGRSADGTWVPATPVVLYDGPATLVGDSQGITVSREAETGTAGEATLLLWSAGDARTVGERVGARPAVEVTFPGGAERQGQVVRSSLTGASLSLRWLR